MTMMLSVLFLVWTIVTALVVGRKERYVEGIYYLVLGLVVAEAMERYSLLTDLGFWNP